MSAEALADPADPLRLGVCPGCAYQLEGLPPEGVCPECGRPYDQQTVFLFGWGAGSKADAGNAKPWPASAMAAVPLAYCAFQMLRAWRKGRFIRLSLFGLWAAVILWYLWHRFVTFRGPGLAQVRLSDSGCVQADSTAAADASVPTPWDQVGVATLEKAAKGTRHLRLASAPTIWSSGTVYVDAEVQCTDDQAAALERRIAAWRERAGGKPALNTTSANKPAPPRTVPPEVVTCGPAGQVP